MTQRRGNWAVFCISWVTIGERESQPYNELEQEQEEGGELRGTDRLRSPPSPCGDHGGYGVEIGYGPQLIWFLADANSSSCPHFGTCTGVLQVVHTFPQSPRNDFGTGSSFQL